MEGAFPIGIVPDGDFSIASFALQEGDNLFLMSDGVVEATDPQGALFGFERISELLQKKATSEEIANAAQEFGQEDDILVVQVRRNEAAVPPDPVPSGQQVCSANMHQRVAGLGPDRLHIHGYLQRVRSAAQHQAAQRAHVAIVASPRQRHVAIGWNHIIRRIDIQPSTPRTISRHPRMRCIGAHQPRLARRLVGPQISTHIARRQINGAQTRNLHMRKILAHSIAACETLLRRASAHWSPLNRTENRCECAQSDRAAPR